jgi:hypothetical protein
VFNHLPKEQAMRADQVLPQEQQQQKPNMAQQAMQAAKDWMNKPEPLVTQAPIGTGAVNAFIRQGFKELGAVAGKAFPDSVQIDEPGTAFNLTPGIVTSQMTGRKLEMDMDR